MGADVLPGLKQYLGQRFGPFHCWDPVNASMIRHWCEAMGDTNPIYTDVAAARAHGHAGLVAPPTMLHTWVMTGYNGLRPPGSATGNAFEVLDTIEQAGFPGVVAVNCEQEYFRYLREGERIHYYAELESVSKQKATALGTGYFCTELSTFYNQEDEAVGSMRFRVLKYRPANWNLDNG
ncbi:MAG: MaoC family dehydratase N-terminal domain-containing protein [Halieaceae bacterium]|nr:MaoC family dehydratase N-terminal domain-containing protein [Halieaceae bacterium]